MMEERDDIRKQDPASPRLSTMNDEITKATSDHKRRQWRDLVESIDHRTDSTKLWRTIKGIDGKSKQTEENEGITFHRKTPHLTQDDSQQFQLSVHHFSAGQALFIEQDSSGVKECKADVSRGSGICGASPQDVRHLFACTTHPTDLSPET